MRDLVKAVAFRALGSPPVAAARLRKIGQSGVLTILSLHRVAPMDGSTYPPLDPQLFRELLQFCLDNFTVVTFGELEGRSQSKPPLILSFDDGYKDFADYAAPILDEFGLRCNHNLIPRAIETGLPPFNVVLNDYAGMAQEAELFQLKTPGFRGYTRAEGRYAWGNDLSHWFKGRSMAEQHQLAESIAPQLGIGTRFRPTPMMSRDEAAQIAARHEIGAHSFEHANLSHETDAYAANDAQRCRAWFAEQLEIDVTIYALPNGDYRAAQLGLIEAAGFTTLLLVGQRFSSPQAARHFRFNFDASAVPEMRYKALGGSAPVTQ